MQQEHANIHADIDQKWNRNTINVLYTTCLNGINFTSEIFCTCWHFPAIIQVNIVSTVIIRPISSSPPSEVGKATIQYAPVIILTMWSSFWSAEFKCVLVTAGKRRLRNLNMHMDPRNASGSFAWVFLWLTKENALQQLIKKLYLHYINVVGLQTQCSGHFCVQGPPSEK